MKLVWFLLGSGSAFIVRPLKPFKNSKLWSGKDGNTKLSGGRTLYDKIFDSHVVSDEGSTCLVYVDRHLVHEVTSPQAFEGLRLNGRSVRRPDCTLATVDHNVPTSSRESLDEISSFIEETASRTQVLQLEKNVGDFGLKYFGMADERQGIVHIIGPEQGFTLPGCITVCGDSHTATHGAFGALAFGIGTSEVEHVLATQTLSQTKTKNMRITIDGNLCDGVTSKDIVLHIISLTGTGGGTGFTMEFAGSAIRALSMEARMSISNMAIEAGARAGIIAPDEVTFEYCKNRPMSPSGDEWDKAVAYWKTLQSDEDAVFDEEIIIKAEDIVPTVTWGTSPQDAIPVTGTIPMINDPSHDEQRQAAIKRSLAYIGLEEGQKIMGEPVDKVFIGSCTNGRIEDLRSAAAIAYGRKVADNVYAMVVPGSGLVKKQAEEEGLDKIFEEAGFDWREPGCSMCLAMNDDKLKPQERCASTSNRNFEGRQGNGGRTHLMSPGMAAAAAVAGSITDVRLFPFLGNKNNPVKSDKQSRVFSTKSYPNPGPLVNPRAPYLSKVETNDSSSSSSDSSFMQFTVLNGVAAPLDIQNVDTDMIIPKEFLKTIKRSGLGFAAFAELRYNNPLEVATLGEELAIPNPDFILNSPLYQNAEILVCGDNFGCGSSREHAPWSIKDMGINCLIGSSFADIFYNNCFNNGMLPIVLPRDDIEILLNDIVTNPGMKINVDLEQQSIESNGLLYKFEIEPFKKHCLLNGLDKIGLTLQKEQMISDFESQRSQNCPWLDGAAMKVPDEIPMYPEAQFWSNKETVSL